MGGKKKLSLKQMERRQVKKDEKRERGGAGSEKKPAGIVPPDPKSGKVVDELKKMRALTPYTVAARFNLRLSVAKDLLDELAQKGQIEYVSGSKSIKIYRPVD